MNNNKIKTYTYYGFLWILWLIDIYYLQFYFEVNGSGNLDKQHFRVALIRSLFFQPHLYHRNTVHIWNVEKESKREQKEGEKKRCSNEYFDFTI